MVKIVRMKTKLTLSITKTTLLKAKRLSVRKKTSLSKLFEEYVEKNQTSSDTPISDALTGVLGNDQENYKEMRRKVLRKKYDL